jgi:hypothetical protein
MTKTTHYISSLTIAESACGHWDTAMAVSLDLARVNCAACLRRIRQVEIPEQALLRSIRTAARDYGWNFYHTLRSDGSEKGWPDCAIAKPGYPLYLAELKTAKGKLTMEQQHWQRVLTHCTGVQAEVWRPADLPRVLALLARRPHDA